MSEATSELVTGEIEGRSLPFRVLHVSEAFGGGLASAVQEYARSTPEIEHELAYAARPEAPLSASDTALFSRLHPLPSSTWRRLTELRQLLASGRYNVVHAHSAFAGAYVRAVWHRADPPIVYTPHCYGFNRLDYAGPIRLFFWAVEKVLARRTAVYAACSPEELSQSGRLRRRSRRVYVPNIAPDAMPLVSSPHLAAPGGVVRVVGAGRLNFQKDPGFFVDCVTALRASGAEVHAEWIGDGEPRLRRRLVDAGVMVTGWVPRDDARKRLASDGTLYLHTALWEGFPIAVLEAARAGMLVCVRNSLSYRGIAFPLVIDRAEQFVECIGALRSSPEEQTGVINEMSSLLRLHSKEVQRSRLLEAYEMAEENLGWKFGAKN